MRVFSKIAMFCALAIVATASVRAEDGAQLWRICAQSELIVSGTLSVQLNKSDAIPRDSSGYAPIFVKVERTLKGKPAPSLIFRHYAENDHYGVSNKTLVALDGHKVVVFLLSASTDGVNRDWYLAGYREGIEPETNKLTAAIALEVARQDDLLHNWKPTETGPVVRQVHNLIQQTLEQDTEAQAFVRLEALGTTAVPAIIDQMDDRRALAKRQIALRNFSPNRFEEFRLYGPEKVVDALAAILNQITSDDFGFIYNGGTDEERARTVAGWRVYQGVLLHHPEWLVTPVSK